MSANVYWKPSSPAKPRDLGLWAPQSFMRMMEEAFGSETPVLDAKCLPILRGMEVVWGEDKEQGNPFTKLIKAIKDHGSIELEVEY